MSNQIIKEEIQQFRKIQEEWEKHRTMNTCSICDYKGHTSLEDFLASALKRVQEEERKRIVKGLQKEYRGQVSQVQDAINYVEKLIEDKGRENEKEKVKQKKTD